MEYKFNLMWLVYAAVGGGIAWLLSKNGPLAISIFALILTVEYLRIYVPYSKDNPQGYWFKNKLYGWGWVPVTWQGWLVTFGYIALVVFFSFTIDESSPLREVFFTFFLPFVLLTITFIRIAYKTGEKPRWRWGRDDKKKG